MNVERGRMIVALRATTTGPDLSSPSVGNPFREKFN